jgi:nanoRNase/pAp phosphatase (c-di-AMP/oligoRNAs hydrolase)
MPEVSDSGSSEGPLYTRINQCLESFPTSSEVKGLILTHRQADPDALCAAGALKLLLEANSIRPKVHLSIVVPQGASVLGKQVSSKLSIEFSEKNEEGAFDDASLLIAVDTGDPKLLEPYESNFEENSAKKILIDHHASSSIPEVWKDLDERIISPNSTSTCEMIALGFPQEMISQRIAEILLTGIMFDSQHLGIATKNTLEAALLLVNSGAEISKSKKLLRHDPDRSEILGKFKAAQRLRFEEVAGRIIARSEISSYHAAVARMLVEMGADVGVAYGESNGEARLSARSTQAFFKETRIDLSEEIRKLAERYDMAGGGHSTAASISGKMETGILSDSLVQNLKSRLLQN